MRRKLLTLTVCVAAVLAVQAQNIGIGTNDPKVRLDIEGGFSLREGAALILVNGDNDNIALAGNYSFYRITGPTATFSIKGIAPGTGADGQMLTLVNTTSQVMIIKNNSSGISAHSILTLTGNDIASVAGGSSITLQYNKSEQKWYVTGSQNIGLNAVTASNGLNTSGGNTPDIKLGGTLSANTSIALNNHDISFTGTGNMGIGTTPVAGNRLQVSGKTSTTTFQMTSGAGNGYLMRSDASGNASWVNSSPDYKIPSGVIVMWSGSFASIPSGWVLCDGSNGTPDLRDRFLLGATVTGDVGDVGGSHNHTLTVAELPSHTHSFTTGSATPSMTFTGTALPTHNHSATFTGSNGSTSSAGAHTHSIDPPNTTTSTAGNHHHALLLSDRGWPDGSGDRQDNYYMMDNDKGNPASSEYTDYQGNHTHTVNIAAFNFASAGSHTHTFTPAGSVSVGAVSAGTPAGTISGGAHTHSGTTNATGSGTAIDIRPAFYKLAFIIKQ